MQTRSLQAALILGIAGMLSACVTINIYFPAAAAEKAADKIIEDIWQLKKSEEGKNTAKPAEPANQSKP